MTAVRVITGADGWFSALAVGSGTPAAGMPGDSITGTESAGGPVTLGPSNGAGCSTGTESAGVLPGATNPPGWVAGLASTGTSSPVGGRSVTDPPGCVAGIGFPDAPYITGGCTISDTIRC